MFGLCQWHGSRQVAGGGAALSPLDGVFGLCQWHGSRQVAGGWAALEVDPVSDAAPVQILILDHVIAVTDVIGVHLLDGLETDGV